MERYLRSLRRPGLLAVSWCSGSISSRRGDGCRSCDGDRLSSHRAHSRPAVSFPSGGGTETFVNQFRIQATGGAQGYLTTQLFHITVTPDGTAAVALDNFSTTC
jgi:hypothetical protein